MIKLFCGTSTPPPLVVPHPLSFPGGGGWGTVFPGVGSDKGGGVP